MSDTIPTPPPRNPRRFRLFAGAGVLHIVLVALAISMTLPFVWMVLTSLKSLKDVATEDWLPSHVNALTETQVNDPAALMRDIAVGQSPLADYLRSALPAETVQSLKQWANGGDDAPSTHELAPVMLDEINKAVLMDRSFYSPQRFPDAADSPEIARLLAKKRTPGPDGKIPDSEMQKEGLSDVELAHLNRLLLEHAYGQEIEPSKRLFHWENYAEVFNTEPRVRATGTVTAIEPGKSVTVDMDGQSVQIPLDDKTQVVDYAGGMVIPHQRLSVGQKVTVDREAGKGIQFGRFYWNSLFIAAWVTFLQVFTCSLAAFSFSRLKWKGRDKVFLLYLGTMMLPGLVMMIPNYQIMIKLGLVDSYAGLILPAAFSAFGTFLLRQFMLSIPTSLDEAAEIDGASKWGVFWNVILPLCRPGLITLTIFTFMGTYGSFFWPLVMLKSIDKYTLPIGLLYFNSTRGSETHLTMAAATMMVIPLIILFVCLQKYLVKGIQLGAVKG